MFQRVFFYVLVTFVFCFHLNGQSIEESRKELVTVKTFDEIKIDGILGESIWKTVDFATDFVQYEPNTGSPATFKSKVKVVYDDNAVYIGAELFDPEPNKILKEQSLRDDLKNADNFSIILDTYQSGQNGFGFLISASDVQRDYAIINDDNDYSWNAVWESKISITDKGWTVEVKIPYSAIRFPATEIQKWNIQFSREIRRFRETSYWNPVNREMDVFLIQSGKLSGIQDIKTPIRLSLTPFVATYLNTSYDPNSNDFSSNTAYNAGMDVKYGISDAFTLDMTLIPDFGQTITDQQVLNLSPFEVFFEENRQFFTEGLELFNNQELFYTRRVGGKPFDYNKAYTQASPNETVVENPDIAHLYNATKITGRTSSGMGIGFFNAIEKEQHATLQAIDGTVRRVKTNPLTNYNVLVVDQNLPNNSLVRIMNANVIRKGSALDANNTGIDLDLKSKDQRFKIGVEAKVSQRFEKDKTDVGYQHAVSLEKIGGKWLGEIGYYMESYNFNPNDLGLLFAPNEKNFNGEIRFTEYKPKSEKFQFYRYTLGINYNRLHRPNEYSSLGVDFDLFYLYKTRFAFGTGLGFRPIESRDYFEPRSSDFSLYMPLPGFAELSGFISSDYRKPLAYDVRLAYTAFDKKDRKNYFIEVEPRIRFNDRFTLKFSSSYRNRANDQGFVRGLTQENKTLIGTRNRQILENVLSGNFIFSNKMGINFFVRHYWDKVRYNQIDALLPDGKYEPTAISNYDLYGLNFNFFSLDIQYQWRFAPGSDISVLWKNIIESSGSDLEDGYFQNFGTLFDNSQFNNFSVKVIYYLDYNQLMN
jgi:hypothetical protein